VIGRVIISLDQSELSEAALPFGLLLARTLGASIELVHVIDDPQLAAVPGQFIAAPPGESDPYLKAVARRLDAADRLTLTVRVGDAADEILSLAAGAESAMIAMATRGRGGLSRMLLGSVADKVVRNATVPVALVRGSEHIVAPEHRLTSLLVPLDGSETSALALPVATELARRSGAALHLLRVVEPVAIAGTAGYPLDAGLMSSNVYADLISDLERDAREYLDAESRARHREGYVVSTRVVVGTAVEEILNVADEVGADAIVLASRGRGGIQRVVLGSVATGVLQRGVCPLIVVPARVAAGE
jgi:nucleotide-binding universal stress UspA family protein